MRSATAEVYVLLKLYCYTFGCILIMLFCSVRTVQRQKSEFWRLHRVPPRGASPKIKSEFWRLHRVPKVRLQRQKSEFWRLHRVPKVRRFLFFDDIPGNALLRDRDNTIARRDHFDRDICSYFILQV